MKTNKIYAESSVGDLIDRITILEIKKLKILKKSDLAHVNKESGILKKILKKNIKTDSRLKKLWKNLKAVNGQIWKLEDEKRLTQKYLEKLSDIAKNVYKLNDDRAKLKLKINKITKSNIREVKNYAKY